MSKKADVRRAVRGGPWDGRGITVPKDLKTLECGRMTGMYYLAEDNAFEFRLHTKKKCDRPYAPRVPV